MARHYPDETSSRLASGKANTDIGLLREMIQESCPADRLDPAESMIDAIFRSAPVRNRDLASA